MTNDCISKRASSPEDRVLQATPVGHAMAMQGAVNCAMYTGATLVLQGVPRPTEMLETIQRERVTSAFMVPTQLEGIVSHPDLEKYDVRSLKVIDDEERELPPNTEGELVARGPEVFTGYYKTTEEENREVFTRDGYYRTGDLAKIDERGYIRITGRKKDVIRRGGETLVPSEMEDLIRRHPDVDRVAVVGMPDPKMGERACAYVVPKSGKGLTLEEMVEFLRGEGASVLLLPERLEIAGRLPETGVGKVDKKALRKDIAEKLAGEEGGALTT